MLRNRIGKEEIAFSVAIGGLTLMTIGAVFFKQSADTALVTGFVGMLGIPIFAKAAKKDDEK